MAASGASDDGDRLARKRQPAAPQEEESIAPSVSSGAEEESMRSRSPRSEPQASGSDQKRQPAAPQPERQPAAAAARASGAAARAATEVVQVNVPNRIEYRNAADRPLLNALVDDWLSFTFAEDLEVHDVADMMLAWSTEAQPAAASGATRGPAETVCFQIMQKHKEHKNKWKESDPSISSMSMPERSLRRADTSNWKSRSAGTLDQLQRGEIEIGRASCRERV